jgi:hypothetical protein
MNFFTGKALVLLSGRVLIMVLAVYVHRFFFRKAHFSANVSHSVRR